MNNIAITKTGILDVDVDVIVNPANGFLNHGAGLARIIANAAGPELWAESKRMPTVATGDAVATTAGNLPFKAVIHAVGPVWKDGTLCEPLLLQSAHLRCLEIAEEMQVASIAFPAISCGLFRFPPEIAAPLALRVAASSRSPLNVVFCLPDDVNYDAFKAAHDELQAAFEHTKE